ncbi:MAG: hypothetical protein JSV32_06450 [Dehalococcoidia bacterium]|nr:MAG: hypothetical protein JSV32_06450 [Dehalococcoidia bacterium]
MKKFEKALNKIRKDISKIEDSLYEAEENLSELRTEVDEEISLLEEKEIAAGKKIPKDLRIKLQKTCDFYDEVDQLCDDISDFRRSINIC